MLKEEAMFLEIPVQDQLKTILLGKQHPRIYIIIAYTYYWFKIFLKPVLLW